MRSPALLVMCLPLICLTTAAQPQTAELRTGAAAFGDWQNDAPGVRRLIRPSDLPPPTIGTDDETPDFRSLPKVVPPSQGALPKVPEGFAVQVFASGLDQPRIMRLAPNGDIFLAESGSGRVLVSPANATAPARPEVFAEGLERPYGIVFYPPTNPQYVYVAAVNQVVRYPYRDGDTKARGPAEAIVANIPTRRHWTRDLAISRDGSRLFVAVGSGSNLAGEMSDLPPDQIREFERTHGRGATYIGGHEDPRMQGQRPDLRGHVLVPEVLIQAHSAALSLAFYDRDAFPPEYRGDAFVALHGSWNRPERTGYKVIRVRMRDGQPTGEYDDFLTGFVIDNDSVWGRPAGGAVTRDGALLVSDDANGTIFRITRGSTR